MLVGRRMSHPVITIHPDTSLEDAFALMQKECIRRLPVVDKHGMLVGIISERQLIKASPSAFTTLDAFEIKGMMGSIKVDKVMTKEVTTVKEDTPLEEAARIMADLKIGGLPVVRDGEVVGMITETDIFKVFLEVLGAREPGVRLTVLLQDRPGSLLDLTKAIFEAKGNIHAVGSFLGESSENSEITLKVSNIDLPVLEKAVKPLVEKIVDIRVTKVA